ncbi:hypothetical protein Ptr902_00432 [Pyrenophora tritici-repentis]|nr:hypothetical protein Ptr902_00432 [Pyrenophora tritici-repentis]
MQPLRILSSVLLTLTLATASPVADPAMEVADRAQLVGKNRCPHNPPIPCGNGLPGCPFANSCASAGVCYYEC